MTKLADAERARRASLASPLARSADNYVVDRDGGRTIIAGFPGSPTGAATRSSRCAGLCWHRPARRSGSDPLEWAGTVSEGMLPNRFPDAGEPPEYNSVDASLWFVVAVHEFLRGRAGHAARRDGASALRARRRCDPRRLSRRHALRHRARRGRPAAPRACRACSSPGWTRRWATGW